LPCVAVCCSVVLRARVQSYEPEAVQSYHVAVCCSVLQGVVHFGTVWCIVLQCVAVCCSVLQCGAVCCSVLQCVAVLWVHVLQCVAVLWVHVLQCVAVCCSVLQCVAVCYNVVHCVAVCCSVLQCVAVCCSLMSACVAVCCSLMSALQSYAVCCKELQCVAVQSYECTAVLRSAVLWPWQMPTFAAGVCITNEYNKHYKRIQHALHTNTISVTKFKSLLCTHTNANLMCLSFGVIQNKYNLHFKM